MKLKIHHGYFEEIKAGAKTIDYRDAHITFIDEDTGETIVKKVIHADVIRRSPDLHPDVLTEDHVVRFFLERPLK